MLVEVSLSLLNKKNLTVLSFRNETKSPNFIFDFNYNILFKKHD